MVRYFSQAVQTGDESHGITFYVGGAGPLGHVGSIDVPLGLQEAGYRGRVQVFTWQGVSHARDQVALEKNRRIAPELSAEIRRFALKYPDQPINIIALSAGTGIATFALEYLPEKYQVDNVVFLASSISSTYNLTRALKRVRGRLYVVYSPHDRILRDVVKYAGTVDRRVGSDGVAGLAGVRLPSRPGPDAETQYAKLRNIPYRSEFGLAGYSGGHMDATAREFIREHVAGIIMGTSGRRLDAEFARDPRTPTTLPARPLRRPAYDRALSDRSAGRASRSSGR